MNARMQGEPPSLPELVEFCEGDTEAACWILRTWGRYHAADACNDPAYALQFWRVTVCGYFDQRREEFEAGRSDALFDAVKMAAMFNAPIPEWARIPFMEGWRRYQDVVPDDPSDPSESPSTLGGAFGINRPENFNKPAARFWGEKASLIWSMVTRRHQAGEKIGPAMFAAVAEELKAQPPNLEVYAMLHGLPVDSAEQLLDARTKKGISAGTVSRVYYGFKAGIAEHESKRKGQPKQPKTESEKVAHALRGWR